MNWGTFFEVIVWCFTILCMVVAVFAGFAWLDDTDIKPRWIVINGITAIIGAAVIGGMGWA